MSGNYKKWMDRINSKQDTLTENNLGQFMDSELATKSAPTSGDTVLGRDSVTGKAVEIPTSSLVELIDVSNLVSYNGANKDVNIGSNYFKTSKGFNYTFDENNYFIVDYLDSFYNKINFKSYGSSFGYLKISGNAEEGFNVFQNENIFSIQNNVTYSSKKFLSDLGFDYIFDENNYFRTFHDGNYNQFEFNSNSSEFGDLRILANVEEGFVIQRNYGLDFFNLGISSSGLQFFADLNSENKNIFRVYQSNTYSKQPYKTDSGFKITNGTPNLSLTADGGTFDLDTKADLVGGKVPSSQLPSYVDDVLEYASWVNFPATGESGKIYIAIDTNITYRWTGTGYAEISASLALGETSSTAYRGDRGKAAYDHSQATGNPHNTELEELTDVSGDATSIADTDVILKKEAGGFWKKITWENIKASLKTYFDSLYTPKSFNAKVTTPSSYVTGTISETEVLRIEIPANSISDNSFFNMPILFFSKLGTNGNLNIKGKLSTSPTMPSGTTDVIFGYTNIAATNISFGMDRMYIISDGLIKGFPFGISSYSSSNANSNSFGSKAFDRTVTNYLYISIQLGNSSDQARLEGVQLINQ